MSTFEDRLGVGTQLERRVARELRARQGWMVAPWGQGVLPEAMRGALRSSRTGFRYFPDLVAMRPGEVVTIDAKDRMHSSETGRYAVARECVKFGLRYLGAWDVEVYYVFGNLGVITPAEVRSYARLGPGGAYYLVSEHQLHHFDDVFGCPASEDEAA